jgi:putative YphP/YqiW family bacilliredoxin
MNVLNYLKSFSKKEETENIKNLPLFKTKNDVMYPPDLVAPMKEDLTSAGFQQLVTPAEVDNAINETSGTTLLVINSVCGCAAANARPAAKMSVDHSKKPEHLVTVFAGVDKEAVEQARKYTLPYPPSSPSMALFKDGKLVHFIERHHIEGRAAEMIAENLQMAYNEFC